MCGITKKRQAEIMTTATLFYLHDFCDLLPLLLGRVGAGGVVSAGMEDKYRMFGSFLLREKINHLNKKKKKNP